MEYKLALISFGGVNRSLAEVIFEATNSVGRLCRGDRVRKWQDHSPGASRGFALYQYIDLVRRGSKAIVGRDHTVRCVSGVRKSIWFLKTGALGSDIRHHPLQ